MRGWDRDSPTKSGITPSTCIAWWDLWTMRVSMRKVTEALIMLHLFLRWAWESGVDTRHWNRGIAWCLIWSKLAKITLGVSANFWPPRFSLRYQNLRDQKTHRKTGRFLGNLAKISKWQNTEPGIINLLRETPLCKNNQIYWQISSGTVQKSL